jgi:signal peptidase
MRARAAATIALKALQALACLAIVAGWFLLLRPASLGGPASYVIVAGRSMEPGLRMHDLAIVRKQGDYHTGDVIAFRVPEGEVIHRIVGGDAESGFVTKGDNNEEPDLWRPRPADIKGALWFRIPAGGRVLEFVARPVNAAILAGSIAAFWLLVGEEMQVPLARRRRKDRSPSPAVMAHPAAVREVETPAAPGWLSGRAEGGKQ